MARHKTAAPTEAQPTTTYLTSAEVGKVLAVCPQTLSYWRARNTGPVSIKVGGSVRYPAVKFREWLERQTAETARGEGVA